MYTDLRVKIDEIAERIRTLGYTAVHTFSTYLDSSSISPVENVTNGREAVKIIVESFSILLPAQRDLLDFSGDAGDEDTNALMSDYIREQEKLVWMYFPYLG